jgi:D-3-phosphoglycerate dehydrogenase / 2-oxoglutarate reductase
MNNTYYIIDFDSTFTKVEGLDELANIALAGSATQEKVVTQIRRLTEQGMNGEITFSDALSRRIELLKANRSHIKQLVDFLHTQVSESFQRNEKFPA